MQLERSFFQVPTDELARRLIGCCLVHRLDGQEIVGRIVETEAYFGEGDPASHSHCGETARNRSMFGEPGTAYVYLIYGMHLCLNVVSAASGVGEAVLLRALEPLRGLEAMRSRRGGVADRELCRGPGKLSAAFGLTREHDGVDLCAQGGLQLWSREAFGPGPAAAAPIVAGPRVGISKAADLPLRFRLEGSPWVSR